MAKEKIAIPRVRFTFIETERFRLTSVDELPFDTQMYSNSLKRGGMKTIGAILDNWDNIGGAAKDYAEKHNTKASMGMSRIKHIRAAVFAYLCEQGLVNLKQEVEVEY